MSEDMTFLPKRDLLTLEELDRICSAFVDGASKLRITGGEPLVRRDIMTLFRSLSRHLESGALEELRSPPTARSSPVCEELAACGVKRINVSIDTLDPDKFRRITRWGELAKSCRGSTPRRRRPQGQDQHRGAERRERGRDRNASRMGAWARHGPDAHRGHAARRDRRAAHRPVSAALHGARTARERLHAGGSRRPHRRTGALRAREGDRRAGSASSRQ